MKLKKLDMVFTWEGPFDCDYVIDNMKNGGNSPDYDGDDYGIYQIYGKHIIDGDNTLLYIGKAARQRFSTRFIQHKKWLDDEKKVNIYLGRTYNAKRHSKNDKWEIWEQDIELAEKLMIYKYSPNYNSSCISKKPWPVIGYSTISLIHEGKINKLCKMDLFPKDF